MQYIEYFVTLSENNSVNAFIGSFQIYMKDICCLVAERELTDKVLKCIFDVFNASANNDYFAVINDECIHDPNAMKKLASDAKQEVMNLEKVHFAIPTEIKETGWISSKCRHWVYFYYDIVTRKSVHGDSLGFSLPTNLLTVMLPIFQELLQEYYKFHHPKPELMHIPCNEEIFVALLVH